MEEKGPGTRDFGRVDAEGRSIAQYVGKKNERTFAVKGLERIRDWFSKGISITLAFFKLFEHF